MTGCSRFLCIMLIGTALLSAAPAAAVDRSGFPLTVTDDQGIALTLAAKPQRIVSLTLPTDEMLLSLVEKSRLVGITTFAMDRVLSNVVDLAADIPEKLTLNVEKVISLRPDLLLVAPWNDSTQVLLLRKAGVPVYMMSTGATVEEIAQKIGRLAAMTGEAERGAAVVEEMRRKVRLVEQKVATVPEAKRLRVLDYASWGGAQGRGSSWDEVVRRAGLINAASQFSTDKWSQVPLSTEKLLTIDFDILMLSGGMYGNGRASEPFERQFLRDPVLRGLKAVKEGHVYTIPESLKDTTSQYIADAIAWLARTAYPELYR